MPGRAFIPGPLAQAQPRVYKSFRSRQMKGIATAAAGAGLVLWLLGAREVTGYMLAFLAALPGFAYGYYEPEGKPVEYWVRVWFQYLFQHQTLSPAPQGPGWSRLSSRARMMFRVAIRAFRMRNFEEDVRYGTGR